MENIKFKSLFLVLLLALLIIGIPGSGFAEESSDETVERIKALFDIGDDYEYFDKYEYEDYNGRWITSLSWGGSSKSISVGLDEEGNIIGYWKSDHSYDERPTIYKFPKISREDGEKIAKDFIMRLYPGILDEVKAQKEDSYNTYLKESLIVYDYNYIRMVNGLEYAENYVYVSVDTQTGEVTNFNITWDQDFEFPDTEGIIWEEEARGIYKDNMELDLMYRPRDKEAYLGYGIKNTEKTVDAKTGDMVTTSYRSAYVVGPTYYEFMENISSEEENRLIGESKIISRQEASKRILDTFKLGEEYEIQNHRLKADREKDIYLWEIMVVKRVENGSYGVSGLVDAKTGDIIDYYEPGFAEDAIGESQYSQEELLEKAEELIKRVNPRKYEEVEYMEDGLGSTYSDEYKLSYFQFARKINGIQVANEGFRVVLSNVTGKVMSYNHNWSDLEFESPDNIIDENRAKEILLEDRKLSLEYQREKEDNMDIRLVYDFKDKQLIVDAKKAQLIDSREGLLETRGMQEYKDIDKSYARDYIKGLQKYIYLFEGDEFKPKEVVNQKEFFQLLAQTRDIYYGFENIDYLYERFVHDGIVREEEIDKDAILTREEAVKYIIRAFGHEPLEGLGHIYRIEFEDGDDISPNLRGHVAIARGLGIISGGKNFRPKDNLTREEAVTLIYNILNRHW